MLDVAPPDRYPKKRRAWGVKTLHPAKEGVFWRYVCADEDEAARWAEALGGRVYDAPGDVVVAGEMRRIYPAGGHPADSHKKSMPTLDNGTQLNLEPMWRRRV
jgi:hypothetical protein